MPLQKRKSVEEKYRQKKIHNLLSDKQFKTKQNNYRFHYTIKIENKPDGDINKIRLTTNHTAHNSIFYLEYLK